MPDTKVFGIGFHKTATSSLAAALYTVGYNVTGYFGTHDPDIADNVHRRAFALADRFDAAQDTPWPVLYRELDRRYPNSKFILTVRPAERWIRSVVKHFKSYRIPAHEWIYGVETAVGNEEVYLERYRRHNREVQRYFAGRPDDLLVMDITKGDGWEKLCPFLGIEVPPVPFPAQNKATARNRQLWKRGIRYLKRRLPLDGIPLLGGDEMREGVSAAFVRDIVHFHYGTFNELAAAVTELNAEQFVQPVPPLGDSARDLLSRQLREEWHWLKILHASDSDSESAPPLEEGETPAEMLAAWEENQVRLRGFLADVNDESCNDEIPGVGKKAWEIFFHLVESGARRRRSLRMVLRAFGNEVAPETFITFFDRK